RQRARAQLLGLGARQVGVEREAPCVGSAHQDVPHVGRAALVHAGDGHRIPVGPPRRDGLVVPALPLPERIGVDVPHIQAGALVLAAPALEIAHGRQTNHVRAAEWRTRQVGTMQRSLDTRESHSMDNPLLAIRALGQSIWLDNISRDLLESGKLASLIAQDGISGVRSTPTIFEKPIGHSDLYDRTLIAAARDGLDARAIFFRLAYEDIRDGAAL